MSFMFYRCSSLSEINIINFNTSQVMSMSNMFSSGSYSNLNLSNFNTSKVTNM